ncbi:MAG: LTA synthase family protein [Oscillospiraceae bacterium]|nr:LTA synthase family protein [Oscillospiraceae bacterium]
MVKRIRGSKRLNYLATIAAVCIFPYFCYVLMELCYPRDPVSWLIEYVVTRTPQFLLSWIFFSLLTAAIAVLVRRVWIPCAIVGSIFSVATYANYYKRSFWDYPVVPSDLSNISNAVKATKMISMPPTRRMLLSLLLLACALLILSIFKLPVDRSSKRKTRSIVCISFLLSACFYYWFIFIYNDALTLNNIDKPVDIVSQYYQYTFFTTFFSLTDEQIFDPLVPDNYQEEISQIGDEIQSLSEQKTVQGSPDIIVVLLETYYDMDQYGYTFDTDLHANYDKYKQQGYSGELLSCLYGGGTADAEFEVLTGLAAKNAYVRTMGYIDYVYEGMPNIVSYLEQNGYCSTALHAYTTDLFNRVAAYQYLGFDDQIFIDSFAAENQKYARDYLSDVSSMQEMIDTYEQMTQSDSPVFINMVTMQNHLPYTDFDRLASQGYTAVKLSDPAAQSLSSDTVGQLEGMATLEKLTDDAIGVLLDYFSQSDRDVIVVMYGDHQTEVADGFNEATGFLAGKDELQYYVATHKTPYLVWSNTQQVPAQSFGTLSLNSLLPVALNAYQAPRPAYFDWLVQETKNGSYAFVSSDVAGMTDGSFEFFDEKEPEINRYYTFLYDIASRKLELEDIYQK